MRGKIKFLFIIIFSFFINLSTIKAETCSPEKLNELKQKAENIEVTTEFVYDDVDLGIYNNYHITIAGLTDDLYIYTDDYGKVYNINDMINGIIIDIINTGVKSLNIYSSHCDENQIISTINLNLLEYNKYATYEECENISGEQLDVCDKFYEGDLTYSVFQRKVEKYKNSKKNTIIPETNNLTIYGIVAGIVLIITIIVILIIRYKKNKLD